MQRPFQEKILVYRVQAKQDTEAFAVLYDKYVEKIYRFVYFKVSNKEEAEDITSEVFLHIWQYLIRETEKGVVNFRGLLYRITRNQIVDYYRRRAKRQEEGLEMVEEIPGENKGIEEINFQQEAAVLFEEIKKLKQEYQEAIFLRYIEDYSIGEIASILGKGKTAVRVTIHRAKKALKLLHGPQS